MDILIKLVKRLRYCSLLCHVSLMLAFIAAISLTHYYVVRPLVSTAYDEKSLPLLNKLISGRSMYGIDFYLDKADRFYFLVIEYAIIFFLALLVLTYRKQLASCADRSLSYIKHFLSLEIGYLVFVFFITRVSIFLIGVLSTYLIPRRLSPGQGSYNLFKGPFSDRLIEIWIQNDAGWYADIIEHGYKVAPFSLEGQANWAFFPLYPLLVRLLSLNLYLDYRIIGMVVSNMAMLGALFLLYRLVKSELDEESAKRTVLYLCIFPTSMYLSSLFTESLFLFLIVGGFYFARQGKWWASGTLGFFASLTRVGGIVLLPVLLFEYLRQNDFNFKSLMRKQVIAVFLSPLGLVVFMLYLKLITGNPLAFSDIQATWGRGLASPLKPLFEYIANPVIIDPANPWNFASLNFISALIFIWLSYKAFKVLGTSYGLLSLLLILLPLSTGSLSAIGRYELTIFPAFAVVGWIAKNRHVNELILVTLSVMLGFATVIYTGFYNLTG